MDRFRGNRVDDAARRPRRVVFVAGCCGYRSVRDSRSVSLSHPEGVHPCARQPLATPVAVTAHACCKLPAVSATASHILLLLLSALQDRPRSALALAQPLWHPLSRISIGSMAIFRYSAPLLSLSQDSSLVYLSLARYFYFIYFWNSGTISR